MKYLRQYIRNILLESTAAQHREIWGAGNKFNVLRRQWQQKQKEKYPRSSHRHTYDSSEYTTDITHPEIRHARRGIKRVWNDIAYGNPKSAKFWKDPNKVVCCHTMTYMYDGDLQGYFGKNGFYSISKRNKDEISCFGIYDHGTPESLDREAFQHVLKNNDKEIFFTVSPRWISYASGRDSYTEDLAQAGSLEKEFYKQSGLPKRPSRRVRYTLLDEQDIKNQVVTVRYKSWFLAEIVTDNWALNTVYIPRNHRLVDDAEDFCDEHNINYRLI